MKELTIFLDDDGTFFYKRPYVYDEMKGNWQISNDSLILTAGIFGTEYLSKRDSMAPLLKYTDLEERDIFMIKKKKLYPLNKHGIDTICYLSRVRIKN